MKYILSLSYFDLPLHLRSCLLYLTLFPEDYEIKRKRLVHRWISEGFIRGEDGVDLVELGDMYFHELVNRSLIQPVDIRYNGKVSCCRVHDTVLDFLIYMSDKENFSTLLSNKAKLDCKMRRLSLMGNEDQGIIEKLDLAHARSLGVFMPIKQLPSLVKSDALRVLDLYNCQEVGNHHVKDIGRLVQLRYLNIDSTNITELPKQIGGLEYLETLDAYSFGFVQPESVSRLKRLTRMRVSYLTKLPDVIGNMENLQELEDINPFVQSLSFAEELGKLINLRKLKIHWGSSIIYGKSVTWANATYKEKLVSSLCKLDNCKLRNLSITFSLKEEDGFIKDLCFPSLNSVRNIYLQFGQIRWIAKWLLSLANLKKLYIYDGKMEQQDLEMVGSISTLVKFGLWGHYRKVPIIISSSGGFQSLQKFQLGHFKDVMFEAGAMPNLKELVAMVDLSLLKYLSSGFDFGIQHLASLTSISVTIDCGGVKAGDVDAAERAFKSMAEANSHRPALEIHKECVKDMLPDE